MTQVSINGYVLVPQADLADVLAALPQHILLTRAEPGCIQFDVTQDENNPCKFMVNETFVNAQAFSVHQMRAQQSEWGHITRNVARFYQETHTK